MAELTDKELRQCARYLIICQGYDVDYRNISELLENYFHHKVSQSDVEKIYTLAMTAKITIEF